MKPLRSGSERFRSPSENERAPDQSVYRRGSGAFAARFSRRDGVAHRISTSICWREEREGVNGVLAIVMVVISLSGLVIWWPGTGRVKRSLKIDFKANWKRLNWDLHSVIGLWMFAFVFIWGVTGVYVVFPKPFQVVVNRFPPLRTLQAAIERSKNRAAASVIPVARRITRPTPAAPASPLKRSPGDIFLRWFYYLHFGNFGRLAGEGTVGGSRARAPVPVCYGRVDEVNRVLSREARRSRETVRTPARRQRGIIGSSPEQADINWPGASCPPRLSRKWSRVARSGRGRRSSRTRSSHRRSICASGHEAYRVRASFLARRRHYNEQARSIPPAHDGSDAAGRARERVRLYRSHAGRAGAACAHFRQGQSEEFDRAAGYFHTPDHGRRAAQFEIVPAGYQGRLYAEVVPRTFSVVVRQGERLSQLRLFRATTRRPIRCCGKLKRKKVVYLPDESRGEANNAERAAALGGSCRRSGRQGR